MNDLIIQMKYTLATNAGVMQVFLLLLQWNNNSILL